MITFFLSFFDVKFIFHYILFSYSEISYYQITFYKRLIYDICDVYCISRIDDIANQ